MPEGKLIPLHPPKPMSAGAWGSAVHHQRYMVACESRRRCSRCWSAARKRARTTHAGAANGVSLMSGCEWHVRQWVKTG